MGRLGGRRINIFMSFKGGPKLCKFHTMKSFAKAIEKGEFWKTFLFRKNHMLLIAYKERIFHEIPRILGIVSLEFNSNQFSKLWVRKSLGGFKECQRGFISLQSLMAWTWVSISQWHKGQQSMVMHFLLKREKFIRRSLKWACQRKIFSHGWEGVFQVHRWVFVS